MHVGYFKNKMDKGFDFAHYNLNFDHEMADENEWLNFADSKEYSLRKATNQVEQSFHDNKDIIKIIAEIRKKLDDSLMVRVIRIYRDKFFAHLDKKSAMSYVRIDSSSAMKHIDEKELDEWLRLIQKLYHICFGTKLSCELSMPNKEEIIYTFFWQ